MSTDDAFRALKADLLGKLDASLDIEGLPYRGVVAQLFGRLLSVGAPARAARAFVLMFGVARSSIATLALRDNVLAPLAAEGWDYDVMLHTYGACDDSPDGSYSSADALAALLERAPNMTTLVSPECEARAIVEGSAKCKERGAERAVGSAP